MTAKAKRKSGQTRVGTLEDGLGGAAEAVAVAEVKQAGRTIRTHEVEVGKVSECGVGRQWMSE